MSMPNTHLPRLGELELAVLNILWTAQEADVLEVHQSIGIPRGITANTVGSALERLFRKGLVTRQKVSHAYRYSPSMTQDEFAARRILDSVTHSQILADAGLLAAFVDLVAEEDLGSLDQLEALIAEKKANRGQS